MDYYENLGAYNGDADHDMNVYFDRPMNSGNDAEFFDETDLEGYIGLNY